MTAQNRGGGPANGALDLCVDVDAWTKGAQVSINYRDSTGGGYGYRLAGPKYNGSSTSLVKHRLTERDATELRRYLDKVFPLTARSRP